MLRYVTDVVAVGTCRNFTIEIMVYGINAMVKV